MRVVFDANIYISFFLTRGETISTLFSFWQKDYFYVFASSLILNEVKNAFQYPKIQRLLAPLDLIKLDLLLETIRLVYPKSKTKIVKDSKDNLYLDCAKYAKADFLVTGDKRHLLPLKKFGKTKIISPKEFVEILKKQRKN